MELNRRDCVERRQADLEPVKARKKQAKQRQFSILSALRTQPLPPRAFRILASAPGHQRLIVEDPQRERTGGSTCVRAVR